MSFRNKILTNNTHSLVRGMSFIALCLLSIVFFINLFMPYSPYVPSHIKSNGASQVVMSQVASNKAAGAGTVIVTLSSTISLNDILLVISDQAQGAAITHVIDTLGNTFSPDAYFADTRLSAYITTVTQTGSSDSVTLYYDCSTLCNETAYVFDMSGATQYHMVSYYGQCSNLNCALSTFAVSQSLYYTAVSGSATICATASQNSILTYPTGLPHTLTSNIGPYSIYIGWTLSDLTNNQQCIYNSQGASQYDVIGYMFLPNSYAPTTLPNPFQMISQQIDATDSTFGVVGSNPSIVQSTYNQCTSCTHTGGGGGGGSATFVQSCYQYEVTGTASSAACTPSSSVSSGDTLIVGAIYCGCSKVSTLTVSDSLSSHVQTAAFSTDLTFNYETAIFIIHLTSSGSDTITASTSQTGNINIYVVEFSGLTGAGFIDSTGASGLMTTTCGCSVFSYEAHAYLTIGVAISDNSGGPTAWSPGSGFTLVDTTTASGNIGNLEYSTTVNGATTAPMSWSITSGKTWTESSISFYASGTASFLQTLQTVETTSSTSFVTTSGYVTSGDILVVNIGCSASITITPVTISDTLGNSFTSQVSVTEISGSSNELSEIWTATSSSSGTDAITATTTGACFGGVKTYELSSATLTGLTTSTGQGSGSCSCSVTSFSLKGLTLLDIQGTVSSPGTPTPVTNYGASCPYVATGGYLGPPCFEDSTLTSGASTLGSSHSTISIWSEAAISFASSGGSSGTSLTQSFSSNIAAGNIIVVGAGSNNTSDALSIFDTKGNTFTSIGSTASTHYGHVEFWSATVAASGSDTIVLNSTSISQLLLTIYELSGVVTTGITFNTGHDSSNACCSVSSFTLQTISLSVAISNNTGGSNSWTTTSNFAALTVNPSGWGYFGQYSTSATGSSTTSITYGGNKDQWAMISVSLKSIVAVTTSSISATLLEILPGDSIIVSFASVGGASLSGVSIVDSAQLTWTLVGSDFISNIIQAVWVSAPSSTTYSGDTISVAINGIGTGVNNTLECLDVIGLGQPSADFSFTGSSSSTMRANIHSSSPNVLLGPQAFTATPSLIYSSAVYTNSTDVGIVGSYQYGIINNTNFKAGMFYTQGQYNNYPIQSSSPVEANQTSKSGWSQVTVTLSLNPSNVKAFTNTITTTVGITSIGSQFNVAQPLNFDLNNASTWQAISFQQNLVYIFYNTAPYPITINYINIPILNTGGNGSWFIVGIYVTPVLTQPFSLQWVQSINLVPNEPLQNFSFTPNENIPPNSFYSIGIADINVTNYCPASSSLPGWFTTTRISNSTQVQYVSTVSGTASTFTSTLVHTSNVVEGVCPTSPAVYYGVGNYTNGYVGADFLNLNVSNAGSGHVSSPPASVLPNFYTDNQILPTESPVPAIYIGETDNYIHVLQYTTTSTVVVGPYVNAINRLFGNVKVMEGLFVVIVPMIFISITKNSIIVMIFFFIIMVIASPFGLNIIPTYGLILILLVFITAITRHS